MGGIRPGKAKGPWVGSVIDATEVTGGANIGTGTGQVFSARVGHILNFRTLLQGTGITITTGLNEVTISAAVGTIANVGTGTGLVWRDTVAGTVNLKSIKQGTGITITNNADDITVTCTVTGESTTVSNVGTGTGQSYRDMTGSQINLKTIKQGTLMTVTNNADDITIATTAQNNTASNLGTGTGVWATKSASDLRFNSIKAGNGISVALVTNDITITNTGIFSVANVGTGTGTVWRDTVANVANLKSIKQGTNITVTNNADDITITATGSGITSTGTNRFIPMFSPNSTSLANTVLSQYTNATQFIIGFNEFSPSCVNLPTNFNSEADFDGFDMNGMVNIQKNWMLLFGDHFFGTAREYKNGIGYVRSVETYGPGRDGMQFSSIVSGVIYGVTFVNETEKSWEFLTALKMMGVGNTGGNSYDGNASSATPTTIDVSGLSAVRLQNSTGAKLYFKFTNALDNQVLTVYNVSDYAVKIQVISASAAQHHTIYPRKNEYDTAHAILVFSPFTSTSGGGWTMQGQDEMFFALTSVSNLTAVNAASGDRKYQMSLSENTTLSNPTNPLFDGQKILFRIKQGAGPYTLAFDTKYRFSTSLPSPTMTAVNAKTDYFGFMYHQTDDKWDYIAQVQNFT